MRNRVFFAATAAAILAGAVGASACGDKLLALGRGVRFQHAYKAAHPANILILDDARSANSNPTKAGVALSSMLAQAGHRVSTAYGPDDLGHAIQSRRVDFILADVRDMEAVEAILRPLSPHPNLIPVLYKPTKKALAAAQTRYRWAIAAPAKPAQLLATLDAASGSRVGGAMP